MNNLFSRIQTRLGHFLLSHILTKQVVSSWMPMPSLPDVAPIATPWPIPAYSKEQNTDGINERDLEVALQEHRESREVPGLRRGATPFNVELQETPGALMRWYQHARQVEAQETVEISVIELQEKVRKRLDGEV